MATSTNKTAAFGVKLIHKYNKEITKSSNHDSKHFQKRSHGNFYYDYPEDPAYYEYQGYNNNPLQIAGIAGSAGLALKTIKAKSILKLLKIPAGLAVLGGIAALAAGLAPPAVIGSINLPFQRRRLPNSLRWRAVGWMEMGLSQADAARRLNVSRSVVQRLWDQYQSEDSVSRRPVPGRPRATTPAEDHFLALSARRRRTTTVPQLVADHFQASGRRISATTV
ncbi:transposable element Tcb2 transposase [Trichonephila clavipes]|nr:transposable element Tcb2 transposase [Trichonephila clavipes]